MFKPQIYPGLFGVCCATCGVNSAETEAFFLVGPAPQRIPGVTPVDSRVIMCYAHAAAAEAAGSLAVLLPAQGQS